MALWIIVGLILIVLISTMLLYNGLVARRNAARNAWSQIDVQLKRRHDLVPNLVSTVKGYARHERELMDRVTRARAQAVAAAGDRISKRMGAESRLSQALGSLMAVAEAYPDLKASQNFAMLQEELASTENRIAFARQHYNDSVMRYNTACETVPTNLLAGAFRFERMDFFELASAAEREPVRVEF